MWRDKREFAVNEDNRDVEDFTIDELKQILTDYRVKDSIKDEKLKH